MLYSNINSTGNCYDVVICGGGLAGLAQARQLKLNFPDIKILLLERRSFPLEKEKFKVGESTVEASAHWFASALQLKDYFKNNHFTKLGFRYFTGDSSKNFAERPEIGLASFSPFDSYQINRVDLENDLFEMNQLMDVDIETSVAVNDININKEGLHQVIYKVPASGEIKEVSARWVIDAMGRRCFLQRKFKTHKKSEVSHSSSWFWIKDKIEIDDAVSLQERNFHQRMPHGTRYYSTNHIVGEGYWVWLIPLMGGYTSVGIVASENFHDFSTFNSKEKALQWLEKWEPKLAAQLTGHDLINFGMLKDYSYSSTEVFSKDRWACIGEAAVFADPYYSPGISIMAFGNTIVTQMIALDIKDQLTQQDVNEYNDFLIRLNDWLTFTIQSSYAYFHIPAIMALSTLWDIIVGWSFVVPDMFNDIYLHREKRKALQAVSSSFIAVIYKMNEFLLEWSKATRNNISFDFIDYLKIPFINELYVRSIQKGRSLEQIIEDQKLNLKSLEEFAHVIFLMAVRDVMPEKLDRFSENCWLKIDAMTLDSSSWEKRGLFQPVSEPGDYVNLKKQVEKYFKFSENAAVAEQPEAENPFSFSL